MKLLPFGSLAKAESLAGWLADMARAYKERLRSVKRKGKQRAELLPLHSIREVTLYVGFCLQPAAVAGQAHTTTSSPSFDTNLNSFTSN